MKKLFTLVAFVWGLSVASLAHHGGSSTSLGPGSPIETSAPLTLPKGGTVVFTRFEYAKFRKFPDFSPNNIDHFQFHQIGLSHGLTDFLSATVILPYNLKVQDGVGLNQGIGDAKFMLTMGFHYTPSEGLQLNDEDDTAVNLGTSQKTFFGLTGGISIPTGRNDLELGGEVNGALQPGFGSPTATFGLSMTRGLSEHLTVAADIGADIFTVRPGGDQYATEYRANLAGVYELSANKENFFKRADGILELNYQHIGRDLGMGIPELGTGGDILYVTPGLRTQVGDFNIGAAVKIPLWKSLNEQSLQQGSEGLEKYRFVLTVSTFF